MLLALVLALSTAPQQEEIEVHVVVRRFPYAEGQTTVGVRAEGTEEKLFEVPLEGGKGSLKLVPPGPPPHDLRIVDERLYESKIIAARSEPKILYTLGRQNVTFRLWHSGGRVYLGSVDWVHKDTRFRVIEDSLGDPVEVRGLLPLEGAYLEVQTVGGLPLRIDLDALPAPPQVQRFFVPEETLSVRVMNEYGTPMSGLKCELFSTSFVAAPRSAVTDGHGRAKFDGVMGESIVRVDFGEHFIAMETVELDPEGTEEVILMCPPSSEVLFDTSGLSEEAIERLELLVFPSERTLDNRSWIKLSELDGPLRVPAGSQRVLTRFADLRHPRLSHMTRARAIVGEAIELAPGERLTHSLTTKDLPGLVDLEVSVDGKPSRNFQVEFRDDEIMTQVSGWKGPVPLRSGIYDVTVSSKQEDWDREFELELAEGQIVTRQINIETGD